MSEGGFDVQAYLRSQQGNPDKALLVTFYYEAEKQKDASFKNVEMIRIFVDKDNIIERKVTEEDKVRFSDRYEAFKRNEEAPIEGTPISMVAFATPADVSACKAERIFTVEQIVEIADERLQKARLVNFKYRCRDWLEAQRRAGYTAELRDKILSLEEQLKAAREEIRALRQQQDRQSEETPEIVVPKRRGRPPKNVHTADAGQ